MVERLVAIHDDLGVHMDSARAESEYAAAFRDYGVDVEAAGAREAGERLAASPVAVELAGAMDQWIFIRRRQHPPDVEGIQQLLAVAKAADPNLWRNQLRDALGRDALGRRGMKDLSARETLRRLAADADPENLPEASVTRLAFALSEDDVDLAISLLSRAQRIHPDDFWLNADLARQLLRTGRLDEAIRFYSVAVAIRPRSGIAQNGLADALHRSGRLDEAAATFRRAVRVRPDDLWANIGLGAVLLDRGSNAEAQAQFREAEAIRPDDGWVRDQIAQVLAARGELEAAIEESREAVRREPDNSFAHDHLGQALLDAGRTAEAIDAFRAAIRLDRHPGPARDDLGRALLAAGELDEALRWLQRPRREGPSESGRRGGKERSADPAAAIAEVQRLGALQARLPGVLRGVDQPADAAECAEFARLASLQHQHATAARLWRQAFATDPALADEFPAQRRFRAACAAAMAGGPDDRDRSTLDEASRRDWLRQAGEWLEAELRAYDRMRNAGTPQERAAIVRRLGRWQVVPALAALRDAADPAVRKDVRRNSHQELWLDAAALKERILRTGAAAAKPYHP
jgi:eukaryotic-like serine/threonine-protein kinase